MRYDAPPGVSVQRKEGPIGSVHFTEPTTWREGFEFEVANTDDPHAIVWFYVWDRDVDGTKVAGSVIINKSELLELADALVILAGQLNG